MAGYSGTPLPKKLGIKEGHRVALLAAPDGFTRTLGSLPEEVEVVSSLKGSRPFDVIVWFTKKRSELERRFEGLAARLEPSGGLWISWPKRASGVATDVTEDVVREVALAAGLVDNKVCAVDEVWSGLRCVIRRENRPGAGEPRARR
jgi:hypothetical protein